MKPGVELVTLLMLLLTTCSARYYPFSFDHSTFCLSNDDIMTRFMEDDDVIKIRGKTNYDNNFRECVIRLAPSTKAKKQTTMIKFESFHINDCETYLIAQQSPYQFFDHDVSTMFNFSCNTSPGNAAFYSHSGNNLKILLHKGGSLKNYNFIFNVTLTDKQTIKGISSAVIITIGLLVAIAIPGIGCIIYRYLKIKNWSKHQYEADEYSAQSVHGLSSLDPSFTPTSVRYSSMPLGEGDAGSQVCVVGSHDAHGRCTVCHRSHEDFAHVVDLNNDRPGSNDNRETGHHRRNREDYAHLVDIGSATHAAPLLTDSTSGSGRRSDHPPQYRPPEAESDWLNVDDIDEEDIDLSGNDLIPPSYDLVPPSYEEAVGMPKPQAESQGQIQSHSSIPPPTSNTEDSDPLYQNIESLSNDVR